MEVVPIVVGLYPKKVDEWVYFFDPIHKRRPRHAEPVSRSNPSSRYRTLSRSSLDIVGLIKDNSIEQGIGIQDNNPPLNIPREPSLEMPLINSYPLLQSHHSIHSKTLLSTALIEPVTCSNTNQISDNLEFNQNTHFEHHPTFLRLFPPLVLK